MRYLKTFESYILEKYTGKIGEAVPPRILYEWVAHNNFSKVPVDALKEIFKWSSIYKSKYSLSFYDKPKGWDFTIDGTIRISDHWNYPAQGKLHSETVQDGYGQNCWAKGIWNESLKKYDIVEKYELSKDKIEYFDWRNTYLAQVKINAKPSNDIIEFSRFLSKAVDDGIMYYKDNKFSGKVISFKSVYLDILTDNGEKIRIKEYYNRNYKMYIENDVYTASEISKKLGKS